MFHVYLIANTHVLHGTDAEYNKLRLVNFGVTKYVTPSVGQDVKHAIVRKWHYHHNCISRTRYIWYNGREDEPQCWIPCENTLYLATWNWTAMLPTRCENVVRTWRLETEQQCRIPGVNTLYLGTLHWTEMLKVQWKHAVTGYLKLNGNVEYPVWTHFT